MCKSKGGLKLHSRKKHPEINNCAEPDYARMATENLSASQLEDMVMEIFDDLSKDECYPAEMQRTFKTAKVHITNCDELYKQCVKCLAFMLKKNDAETGVLIRNFEKKPQEVPRSCFVGVASNFYHP